jgi:nucleoside-diphosphate-sugar epimerase
MSRKSVLVTGLSGVVGTAIRKELEAHFDLSALSRHGVLGLPPARVRCGDIADFETIRGAFENVDAVVHLAAAGGDPRGDGSDVSWNAVFSTNIAGTYNVFEAARQCGVKRVVYASSGATISGYERYALNTAGLSAASERRVQVVNHETPPRPANLYGVGKLFGENLGRLFADAYGLSVICLRIGSVHEDDLPRTERDRAIWCSHRDLSQIVMKSIEAPLAVRFGIFFASSDNVEAYRDLSNARAVLGYVPHDGVR